VRSSRKENGSDDDQEAVVEMDWSLCREVDTHYHRQLDCMVEGLATIFSDLPLMAVERKMEWKWTILIGWSIIYGSAG